MKSLIAQKGRKCLIIVLPYLVDFGSASDKKKKEVRSFLAFPYGALTIASFVNKNTTKESHCEILDLNIFINNKLEEKSIENLIFDKLNKLQPELVGFSMSFDISYYWFKKLAELIAFNYKKIYMISGGPAITTGYKELIDLVPQVHAHCYSEGERALLNLLDSDDNIINELSKSPWITKESLSKKGHSPQALYEDLDSVVDVDYELVDVNAYSMREAFSPFTSFHTGAKQFFIVTSRGCPFKCVFCAEPSFHGANMRYASVKKIVDHITFLVNKYNLSVLTIYDDQLLMNRDRAKEIFKGLISLNIRIEMPNGVTLSYIDEEMAELMSLAGVDTIFLAIEHGSKRVLKDIILKPIAFDKIHSTIAVLQKYNIFVVSFFVFGLPGEQPSERIRTRNFILENNIDWAFMNYATPLRGSELYKIARETGMVDKKYLEFGAIDMSDYVINCPNITADKIKKEMFLLNLDVNFVHNNSMKKGDYETAIRAFKEVIFRHFNQPFAHYFISQCYNHLGNFSLAEDHFEKFNEIIVQDHEWYSAAKIFNLDCSKVESLTKTI